uniref:Putative lipid carrier protein-like protein n=1 Tax=Caulobacter sp. (strain K31) TaxID=366602 RepID=B0T0Q2_CAUSK
MPHHRHAARPRSLNGHAGADLMMALRGPVEQLLTAGLRRVARRRPEIFERLGGFRDAVFLLAPDDWPVVFELSPRGASGLVRVARARTPTAATARIRGPLIALLGLFDGSIDADAAFFSRSIRVEGDIEAVMALHNALEAAELTLADLLGLAAPASDLANASLALLLRRLAARRVAVNA